MWRRSAFAGVAVAVIGAAAVHADPTPGAEGADVAARPPQPRPLPPAAARLPVGSTSELIEILLRGHAPPPPLDPGALDATLPDEEAAGTEHGEVIDVVGTALPISDRAQVLTVDQARAQPGTLGDALMAARNVAGVARAPLGSAGLALWGALPAESRILVDNVPIPTLYHLGGLRSAFPDSLASDLTVEPAGFGAAQGRSLGGVVLVRGRGLPKDGVHGEVSADFLDAAATLSYGNTRDSDDGRLGAGIQGALRIGYLDRLLAHESDVESLVPLSAYRNYGLQATHQDLASESRVRVFGAFDDVTRELPGTDSSAERAQRDRRDFHRISAMHQRRRAGVIKSISLWGGRDRQRVASEFGDQPTRFHSTTWRTGLRAERRQPIADASIARFGLDVEGAASTIHRQGSLSLPPREGDINTFGQSPSDRVSDDRWSVTQVAAAAYGELELSLFDYRLVLTPAVRIEPRLVSGNRVVPPTGGGVEVGYSRFEFGFEPRLAVRYQALRSLSVNATIGRYQQQASPEDQSSVFGSTSLSSATATHATLGTTLAAGSFTVSASGFLRVGEDLAVRSALESPPVAGLLVANGRSRTVGGQLSARLQVGGLSTSLSYVLSRSQRRGDEGTRWRLSDFDQPHVLTVLAGYQRGGWRFGCRGRLTSGSPRTPVLGATFDGTAGRYQPVFGAHNAARLSAFAQFDVRAERAFELGDLDAALYLEFLNVTARKNEEEVVYNHDFTERDALRGLPPLAVLGGRIRF